MKNEGHFVAPYYFSLKKNMKMMIKFLSNSLKDIKMSQTRCNLKLRWCVPVKVRCGHGVGRSSVQSPPCEQRPGGHADAALSCGVRRAAGAPHVRLRHRCTCVSTRGGSPAQGAGRSRSPVPGGAVAQPTPWPPGQTWVSVHCGLGPGSDVSGTQRPWPLQGPYIPVSLPHRCTVSRLLPGL